MSKDNLPQVSDQPQLQIVEVGTPVVDRLQELGDIVNRINPPTFPGPKPNNRWN